MATPKGVRAVRFAINDTDAIHIYSDVSNIWLQLRRDYPTESDIGINSFKSALSISQKQAIAIAGELLKAATQEKTDTEIEKTKSSMTPEHHGKPWTAEEDQQLLSRFGSGLSIDEIAHKHKRGIGGIQSRLVKHGKMPPSI